MAWHELLKRCNLGYKLSAVNVADVSSQTETYHRIVEAFKFAFGKRSSLGDEDFVNFTEVCC